MITLRIPSETLVEIVANINVIQDSMSRDERITETKSCNGMYCIPSSVILKRSQNHYDRILSLIHLL